MKFKTNIDCQRCLGKTVSTLNDLIGEGKWNVDFSSEDNILTIDSDIPKQDLIKIFNDLGYSIQEL